MTIIRRREFLTGLALPLFAQGALAQPLPARSEGRVYKLACPLAAGSLTPQTVDQEPFLYGPLFQELRKAGFVEGQNLRSLFWTTDAHFDRMPEIVTAVIQAKPDVIFVGSDEYAHHLKAATNTIPVVAHMWDAVAEGFANSLSHPGKNFTGITWMDGWGVIDKWFEILREILPQASKVALLACSNKHRKSWDWCHRSAQRSGFELIEARLNSPVTAEEVTRAFAGLRAQGAEALTVSGQPEIWAQSDLIIRLVAEARLPLVHHVDGLAQAGALIVQKPSAFRDTVRITADYIARVLRGAQPSDLPIFRADRIGLDVNLKTAGMLGIAMPESLLARADTIIE
jgi:putative tryptophan/tyrosine transport system substrate-binding protein